MKRQNIRNEEEYFEVLCSTAGLELPVVDSCYSILMKELYNHTFIWSVANDVNRSLDGLDLRAKLGWSSEEPCNMLEMLLALAIRCEADMMHDVKYGDRSVDWFWMMLRNATLDKCRDKVFEDKWTSRDVNFIITNILYRDYKSNGVGGFFPLKDPKKDQKQIEIWYQLSAYLLENYDF